MTSSRRRTHLCEMACQPNAGVRARGSRATAGSPVRVAQPLRPSPSPQHTASAVGPSAPLRCQTRPGPRGVSVSRFSWHHRSALRNAVQWKKPGGQPGSPRRPGQHHAGRAVQQPALRRRFRCVQIVRWPLPRGVPKVLRRRISGLPLFHRRRRTQPFVLGDRARLHALGLGERTAFLNGLKYLQRLARSN